MKRLSIGFLFMMAVLFLSRCGTSTGSYGTQLIFQGTAPGSLGILKVSTYAATTSVAVAVVNKDGSANGTLTVTDARLALKEIKLKRDTTGLTDAEKTADAETKLTGPYLVNLLTNTVSPSLSTLDLASGNYKSIEFKLDKIEGDEKDAAGVPLVAATDGLFGKSIYLEGTFTGTTASGAVSAMPFTMSYDIDEELKLEGTNLFALTQGGTANVIVAFRMPKWFLFSNTAVNDQNIDFRDITPVSSRIDLNSSSSGNNQKNWQVIKDAVEASMDFGKDSDGDGKLGKTEDQNDDDSSDD